jgi:hypothetical protein
MTFLEAVEDANSEAGIHHLLFANIQEAETFLKSFDFDDYPVNILVPFTMNGVFKSTPGYQKKKTIPLQGWVLTKIDDDMDIEDFRSINIEDKYIRPMREKAERFLNELLQIDDVIDSDAGDVSFSIRPAYAFLVHRAFGVQYTMNVPIVEGTC